MMKTREELKNNIRNDVSARQTHPLEADLLSAILEVLLDIRDLLEEAQDA
jgi:hypothetical protein